jgi:hypothetical protein
MPIRTSHCLRASVVGAAIADAAQDAAAAAVQADYLRADWVVVVRIPVLVMAVLLDRDIPLHEMDMSGSGIASTDETKNETRNCIEMGTKDGHIHGCRGLESNVFTKGSNYSQPVLYLRLLVYDTSCSLFLFQIFCSLLLRGTSSSNNCFSFCI